MKRDIKRMTRRTHITALPGWRFTGTGRGTLGDCSLVVATYDRGVELMRLMNSLVSLPDQPGEVVIVDGHPTAAFSAALRYWAENNAVPFDICYVESPPGLTRQRNVGVDISSREYLFFLDDDAIPLNGYFEEMRRVFRDDREKKVGGLAGCVINEMDRPIPRRWRLRFALGLVPRMEPMVYCPSGTHTPRGLLKPFSGVRKIDVMPGCAWTFRREIFETDRFSCFFEGYSQGEDLEMSLRVGRRWVCLCCGDARILHLPGGGGRPASFKRGQMEMRNRYFIWKRHTPRPGFRHAAAFWLDTAFLVAMDVAWFCARPWRLEPLGHACGTLRELGRCLIRPPRFEEPPARREYVLESGANATVAAAQSNDWAAGNASR
jgi:GT2 family glycosyltransferase